SRRRHTRCLSDWSSDVCSSDLPLMLKNGGGAIVNNSSVAGHTGLAGASIYMASKHAVEGLTKSVALEFAKQGIRVNTVAPGVIRSEERRVGKEWRARSGEVEEK